MDSDGTRDSFMRPMAMWARRPLLACPVYPITDQGQLGLEHIDAIIAYPLNVENLYAALALLDVQAAPPVWSSRCWDGTGCFCCARNNSSPRRGISGRGNKRTFTNRDHMRDTKSVEHVRICCVISAPSRKIKNMSCECRRGTHRFPR